MRAFVTGGASCGKSAYAEQLCESLGGTVVYLAAMNPVGEEGARRVAKHRAQRAGKGFVTVECYEGIDKVLDDQRLAGATVLLECLGNVVANALFDAGAHCDVLGQVESLANVCENLVIVGNEVGCDGVEYDAETLEYQRLLGKLSCELAARSDLVVECVAGMPMVVKG